MKEVLTDAERYANIRSRRNEARMRRLAQMQANDDDPRHGTYYGYVTGCRCLRCSGANMAHSREARARRKEHSNGKG